MSLFKGFEEECIPAIRNYVMILDLRVPSFLVTKPEQVNSSHVIRGALESFK